jgi:hypothetical protein
MTGTAKATLIPTHTFGLLIRSSKTAIACFVMIPYGKAGGF